MKNSIKHMDRDFRLNYPNLDRALRKILGSLITLYNFIILIVLIEKGISLKLTLFTLIGIAIFILILHTTSIFTKFAQPYSKGNNDKFNVYAKADAFFERHLPKITNMYEPFVKLNFKILWSVNKGFIREKYQSVVAPFKYFYTALESSNKINRFNNFLVLYTLIIIVKYCAFLLEYSFFFYSGIFFLLFINFLYCHDSIKSSFIKIHPKWEYLESSPAYLSIVLLGTMVGIKLSYDNFSDFFTADTDPINSLPSLLSSAVFEAALQYACFNFIITAYILIVLAINNDKVTKSYEARLRKKSQSEARRLKGQIAFKKLKNKRSSRIN